MLKTILVLGAAIIILWFVVRVLFSVLGFAAAFLIQALIVGAVAYLLIRIFKPDMARRLRERFSSSPRL